MTTGTMNPHEIQSDFKLNIQIGLLVTEHVKNVWKTHYPWIALLTFCKTDPRGLDDREGVWRGGSAEQRRVYGGADLQNKGGCAEGRICRTNRYGNVFVLISQVNVR